LVKNTKIRVFFSKKTPNMWKKYRRRLKYDLLVTYLVEKRKLDIVFDSSYSQRIRKMVSWSLVALIINATHLLSKFDELCKLQN
jgi:hypothetical protein